MPAAMNRAWPMLLPRSDRAARPAPDDAEDPNTIKASPIRLATVEGLAKHDSG